MEAFAHILADWGIIPEIKKKRRKEKNEKKREKIKEKRKETDSERYP